MSRLIYLEQHPPARTQWNNRRRKETGLVVVHTAESPWRNGALAVAEVIRRRSGPNSAASYHVLIGKAAETIQLIDWANRAFHVGVGDLNSMSMGLSFAVYAAEWDNLDDDEIDAMLTAAATVVLEYAAARGLDIPARHVTGDQAKAGLSGFVGHGELDPGRRTDPGEQFRWARFLAIYGDLKNGRQPDKETPEMRSFTNRHERAIQQRINNRLPADQQITVDGDIGPVTVAAFDAVLGFADVQQEKATVLDTIVDAVISKLERKKAV